MGDRFYDEFKPVLTAADTGEAGFVIHSIRRGFGDALKQRRVRDEERADLLGHAGKSETTERYPAIAVFPGRFFAFLADDEGLGINGLQSRRHHK